MADADAVEDVGQPDPAIARRVEAMAGYGIPPEDVAMVLRMDLATLRRLYQHELKEAAVKANARVAESLFRKATGEGREAVTAAIFWMKTRAGWRETTVHEVGGRDGAPLELPEPTNRQLAMTILDIIRRGSAESLIDLDALRNADT